MPDVSSGQNWLSSFFPALHVALRTPCFVTAIYKGLFTMSGGLSALAITEDDITKMLAATTHIGSDNSETTMEQYIFKKKTNGVNIINLKKTWEKLVLAARAIAAVENPQDVYVVASRPYAQRAVLKFARYIGCSSIAGRFTPGAFTNQIQAAFREPRLLTPTSPSWRSATWTLHPSSSTSPCPATTRAPRASASCGGSWPGRCSGCAAPSRATCPGR